MGGPEAGLLGQCFQGLDGAGTYRAGGEALLPLCHAQALLQARALLHHHIPATVRVLGANAGAGNRAKGQQRDSFASPVPQEQA